MTVYYDYWIPAFAGMTPARSLDSQEMVENTIIYLIGFAGTRKLIIAKEIIAKINIKSENACYLSL